MSDNVKVAVRVRPFNKREIERKSMLCIQMEGKTTTIVHPETKAEKKFTFDFSYWSHDDYNEEPNGLLVPTGPKYADQDRVFQDLGQGVLDNAFKGFNTSLFAYGQTGSGKSYSMVGYSVNKGIVPITCEQLFKKMSEGAGGSTRYNVKFSMLEIYNEKVRDLLVNPSAQPKGGLRVRENPKSGKFEVVDLKMVDVKSYAEIEYQTEVGTKHRTVAATKMNSTSSRAHTIVTVLFEQIIKDEKGVETTKKSEINLVDLAGSERANSTGATGDRLKEGSNINKSLSTLGKVIQALAKGGKNKFVPYRESVLTRLLKNALGGNSKTVMIAALSPADINYDETLSTLRYADQAKQIKNKAVVNESPTERLIRELKEQIEDLKAALGGKPLSARGGAGPDQGMDQADMLAKMEEFQRQMAFQSNAEDDSTAQSSAAATELSAHEMEKQKKASTPHFTNLNEDPALSRIITHFVEGDEVVVGQDEDAADNADGESDNRAYIHITGFGIRKRHVVVSKSGDGFMIEAGSPASKTRVNGQSLEGKIALKHNDRLQFGTNSIFLFVNPTNGDMSEGSPESVDFEFAQEEIAKASGLLTEGGDAEEKERMQQILELFPMVAEVNAISEEMDKKMTFSVALVNDMMLQNPSTSDRTQVMVKAVNTANDNEWLIDRGEFVDRRYQIQELFGDWAYDHDVSAAVYGPPQSDVDPFYIQASSVVVGFAGIFVVPLSMCMDSEDTYEVIDYAAQRKGSVCVALEPCHNDGVAMTEEDILDDPSALLKLSKPYCIKITIKWAEVTNARFSTALRCVLFFGDLGRIETPWIHNKARAEFNYEETITIKKVTPAIIDWMENGMAKVLIESKHKDVEKSESVSRMATMNNLAQELRTARERIAQLENDGSSGGKGKASGAQNGGDSEAQKKMKEELDGAKKRAAELEKEMKSVKKDMEKQKQEAEKEHKKLLKEKEKTISKLESQVQKLTRKASVKSTKRNSSSSSVINSATTGSNEHSEELTELRQQLSARENTISQLEKEVEELNLKVKAAPTGTTVEAANSASDDLKESIKRILQANKSAASSPLWHSIADKVGMSTADAPPPTSNGPGNASGANTADSSSVCAIM